MSTPVIDLSEGHLLGQVQRGIDALFQAGASDITIQSDDYIWAYVNRQHTCASTRRLDDGELTVLTSHFYEGGESALAILGKGMPLDFELAVRPRTDRNASDFDPDYTVRCRANVTRCRVGAVSSGYSITLRTIPGTPPAIKTLNLPRDIFENLFPSQGLVLIAGITGSGKSTLLASANRHRLEQTDPVKILTVEDPIEFTYGRLPSARLDGAGPGNGRPLPPRMPEISQIQLNTHLHSFELAAPNILRRKGDVIVMGEMRDRQSVETGLLLSATGHCTYATVHCETPAEVVARIVSEFPYDSQPSAANKLLDNLRLVVAQKIDRDVHGKGRAFRSWCVFDQAFKAELAELQFQQWASKVRARMVQRGQDFAQQALPLYKEGEIDIHTFTRVAGFNPAEARAYLEQKGALRGG
jgi:defect-in-organelle-trafficking protein DotB